MLFSLSACVGNGDLSTTDALTEPNIDWDFENYDIKKTNQNIYFQRGDGLYKFNFEECATEFFAELPTGDLFNLVVDTKEEYLYFSLSELTDDFESKNSFNKMNLQTGEVSVIKKDLFATGGVVYDNKIYFYSIQNNYDCIMQYDTTENTFRNFESTHHLDSDGYLFVQDGGLYFQSIDLHRISLDDTETKVVLKRENNFSKGKTYQNNLCYIRYKGIEDEHYNYELVTQSLSDESEKIVDRFTVPEEHKNALALPIYYLTVEDDYIYYSFEKNIYRIKTDGNGKEKLSDMSVDGDMFISKKTLYWCSLAEHSGNGVLSVLTDEFKLNSLDLESKDYTKIDFK